MRNQITIVRWTNGCHGCQNHFDIDIDLDLDHDDIKGNGESYYPFETVERLPDETCTQFVARARNECKKNEELHPCRHSRR
jgi:hypothetical protein